MTMASLQGHPHGLGLRCGRGSSSAKIGRVFTHATPRLSTVQVFSFKTDHSHISKLAVTFPTPFNNTVSTAGLENTARGVATLSPAIQYNTSFWWQYMQQNPADASGVQQVLGADAYRQHLERFNAGYAPRDRSPMLLCSAVDEHTGDAFIMFVTKVKNTGTYRSREATKKVSTVHGMYRLQLDSEGRVAQAWCYRSPTSEERSCVLNDPKPAEASWPSSLSLHTCSWQPDGSYNAQILTAARAWMDEVCSKASIQGMYRLAGPDVQYHDGTCLQYSEPAKGLSGLIDRMVSRSASCQLKDAVVLAAVADGNKVFVHWSQAETCRSTQEVSQVEGMSMLVFDQAAQVVQVFEYRTPSKPEQVRLFVGAAEALATGQPVASPGAAAAKPMFDAEAAAALARQEQEWESW